MLEPQEQEEALAFLKRPDLVPAILADCEALGFVGEEKAKLLAYLDSAFSNSPPQHEFRECEVVHAHRLRVRLYPRPEPGASD